MGVAMAVAEASGRLARWAGRRSEMGRGTLGLFSRPGTYSIEKARRLLGFDPVVDLAEGMRRTEAWARAQGLI
jgi:nucleoside-diphosphate-sugar epimerase